MAQKTKILILGGAFGGLWWLWRTIYLSKLPRLEKKLRVTLDWTLDLVFSKGLVQFTPLCSSSVRAAERDFQPRHPLTASPPTVELSAH